MNLEEWYVVIFLNGTKCAFSSSSSQRYHTVPVPLNTMPCQSFWSHTGCYQKLLVLHGCVRPLRKGVALQCSCRLAQLRTVFFHKLSMHMAFVYSRPTRFSSTKPQQRSAAATPLRQFSPTAGDGELLTDRKCHKHTCLAPNSALIDNSGTDMFPVPPSFAQEKH